MGSSFRSVAEVIEPMAMADFTGALEERFGIPPTTFDQFLIYRPNGRVFAIVNRDLEVPNEPPSRYFGMPFLHQKALRLTTGATQKFADTVTRNLFDLHVEQLEDFVLGRQVLLNTEQLAQLSSGGFVIARYRGMVLGQASFRQKEGMILGLLPKTWRPQLYHPPGSRHHNDSPSAS